MGKILALDYGSKRTGIAITDELQLIAFGLTTVFTSELMDFLKQYFDSEKVELVLVGEPKQKDGTHSNIEAEIQKFLKQVSEVFPEMAVVTVDERLMSKMTFQTMNDR